MLVKHVREISHGVGADPKNSSQKTQGSSVLSSILPGIARPDMKNFFAGCRLAFRRLLRIDNSSKSKDRKERHAANKERRAGFKRKRESLRRLAEHLKQGLELRVILSTPAANENPERHKKILFTLVVILQAEALLDELFIAKSPAVPIKETSSTSDDHIVETLHDVETMLVKMAAYINENLFVETDCADCANCNP